MNGFNGQGFYTGKLGRSNMSGVAKTAYQSWCDQRQRCMSPGNKNFKYYGKKGIKVEYTSREFISWWRQQLGSTKLKSTERIVCERIDHAKNYRFGNVILGTQRSNAREVGLRGLQRRKVLLLAPSGKVLRRFKTVGDAAKFCGRSSASVVQVCRGNAECNSLGQVFRYET